MKSVFLKLSLIISMIFSRLLLPQYSLYALEAQNSNQTSSLLTSTGLISWWQAELNTYDEGQTAHGQYIGIPYYGEGIEGYAFWLDGNESFINVPHNPLYDFGATEFTVSLWVNFDSLDGEMVIIEKYIEKMSASSLGWTLTKLSNNIIRLCIPPTNYDATPPSIYINSWINIVITRMRNTLEIYWNNSVLLSANSTDIQPSNSTLKFGPRGNPSDTPGSHDEGGYFLDGRIDEIKIYNLSYYQILEESPTTFNSGSIPTSPKINLEAITIFIIILVGLIILNKRFQR